MAHFAQLDQNNKVMRVIVVTNDTIDNLPFPESESIGIEFCKSLYGEDTLWKQTSYNGNFRRRYCGAGSTYDPVADVFIDEKPFASWVLNSVSYVWEAPYPKPNDGLPYYWDENTVSWIIDPAV